MYSGTEEIIVESITEETEQDGTGITTIITTTSDVTTTTITNETSGTYWMEVMDMCHLQKKEIWTLIGRTRLCKYAQWFLLLWIRYR